MFARMSKYDKSKDMYEPKEIKLLLPKNPDPYTTIKDAWEEALMYLAQNFLSGEGCISIKDGMKVMALAECARISYQENG